MIAKYPMNQHPDIEIIAGCKHPDLEIESPEIYYEKGKMTLWPLKIGGYWLEEFEEEAMSIDKKTGEMLLEMEDDAVLKWFCENF